MFVDYVVKKSREDAVAMENYSVMEARLKHLILEQNQALSQNLQAIVKNQTTINHNLQLILQNQGIINQKVTPKKKTPRRRQETVNLESEAGTVQIKVPLGTLPKDFQEQLHRRSGTLPEKLNQILGEHHWKLVKPKRPKTFKLD